MIKNLTRHETVLAASVKDCRTYWARLKGLLGEPRLAETEACWIRPCRAIHTFGMKYPLDVYFLNEQKKVVRVAKNLGPNRLSAFEPRAHSVLEFASGTRSCEVGDELSIGETQVLSQARKLARRSGQAIVETAFILILFFSVVVGIFEMSRAFFAWFGVQLATTEGARVASIGKTALDINGLPSREEAIRQRITDVATDFGVGPPINIQYVDLIGNPLGNAGNSGEYVSIIVKVDYTLPAISYIISTPIVFQLTGRTVIKNEPF